MLQFGSIRVLTVPSGFRRATIALLLMAIGAVFLLLLPKGGDNALGQTTLKGSIEHYGQASQAPATGGQTQLLDGATGKPLAGVTLSIPERGFQVQTDAEGRAQLPSAYIAPQQPLIMGVQKPGYGPFSVTISQQRPLPFQIKLVQLQKVLVLDTQLRHLGDGAFSSDSNQASLIGGPSDGIGFRLPFQLNGMPISQQPTLVFGSVLGIDTQRAHQVSGNPILVSASPVLIKLNGELVGQLQVNGDRQQVPLPGPLIKPYGLNVLEIETGYQVKPDYWGNSTLDYDDMTFLNLLLYP